MPDWILTALIVVGVPTVALVLVGIGIQVAEAVRLELAERRRERVLDRRLTLTEDEVSRSYLGIAAANPELRAYGRNLSALYLIPDRDH